MPTKRLGIQVRKTTEKAAANAFTLIELLIVVAMISVLAAIAVPNFLEAQTRARISGAKADMRTMATALEAYRVDFNAYPGCTSGNKSVKALERLSTPVAYMTSSLLPDPFAMKFKSSAVDSQTGAYTASPEGFNDLRDESYFKYAALIDEPDLSLISPLALATGIYPAKSCYALWSVGPSLIKISVTGTLPSGPTGLLSPNATVAAALNCTYDPTNGTLSTGEIFRVGGPNPGPGNAGGSLYAAVMSGQQ